MHRPFKKCKHTSGLTLLEILVAVSIFSILMSAMVHFFWSGKQAYLALKDEGAVFKDSELTAHIFERDLNDIYIWNDLYLFATAEHIYFYRRQSAGQQSIARIDYLVESHYTAEGQAYALDRYETPFPGDARKKLESKNQFLCVGKDFSGIECQWLVKTSLTPEELKLQNEQKSDNPEIFQKDFKWRWMKQWKFKRLPVAFRLIVRKPPLNEIEVFSGFLTPLSGILAEEEPPMQLTDDILKKKDLWFHEETV